MRIALTGAGGVVGAALAPKLSGHQLLPLGRDVCNFEHIGAETEARIKNFAPDIFIHAGWMGTSNAERNDKRLLDINYNATLKLMEIAAGAGCKRWVGFGSQAEYAPDLNDPISEEAPLAPDSAYGKTKLALFEAQGKMAAAHGMGFSWLRLFACYGKNYHPSYLLSYLAETLARGEMPELKTPHAVWDYLHADDAAEAVARVIAGEKDGVFNVASGKGVSVAKMALVLAKILNFQGMDALAARLAENKTPATYRVADTTKFSKAFNWKPRVTIEEGLKRFVRRA